jgi:peroxiredoxin
MTRLISLAVLLLIASTCHLEAQTKQYVIKGKIGKLSFPAKAFLFHSEGKIVKVDSAAIERGIFLLKAKSTGDSTPIYLTISPSGNQLARTGNKAFRFYTDSAVITVTSPDSISNIKITGGPFNRDADALKAALAPIEARMEAAKKDDDDPVFYQQKKAAWRQFILSHPGSILSLDALNSLGGSSAEPAEVEPLFMSLSEAVRASRKGKEYAAKIVEWKKLVIGAKAPDFTLYDTLGKPVSLHNFKGKYVLLDFWASWCPPCRAESPFIAKAFAAYQSKNFTVVGITLDNPDKKEAWLKAVHDDHLTWTQVSSPVMWENAAATAYSVKSIPQNFLIGPDGTILAKNLRGDALHQKLKEVFGE